METSLNETPTSERLHIGFFGLRNAGKSSLVNAITNQDLSVVSDTPGTTTDPVIKSMEILPAGPVTIIDTPGYDDEGALGEQRVRRTEKVLKTCDVAVLVVDAKHGLTSVGKELLLLFADRQLPIIVALSKCDLTNDDTATVVSLRKSITESSSSIAELVETSASSSLGLEELKEAIARVGNKVAQEKTRPLISDLITPDDVVVLVIPIDSSAPKGRIILPQQMVMRDVLDSHATCMSCQPQELFGTLELLKTSRDLSQSCIVVTDSQAFSEVASVVPDNVRLTSFSILMARYKSNLEFLVNGARALDSLTDKSNVLIAEGCTHHRQCEDIGTVKIPALIKEHAGAEPHFTFTSGHGFPDALLAFDLVIHCGGCMLNANEMTLRMETASKSGIPMVNYGVAIAHMKGILSRALSPVGISL